MQGRCKATNLCEYCARLAAVETSELLLLDALEYAPTLYVVLTARELLERPACRRHLDKLLRACRRRWPAIEWAVLVEFQRRGALHLNLLVKGVPVEDRDRLADVIVRLWCSRVDAEPVGQWVGEVSDGGGLVRYIALHFLKPQQAPPLGWRGHRVSYTGGYLVTSAAVLRRRAREALRWKRELHKAIERGCDAHEAELEAHQAVKRAARTTWVLATDRGARISDVCHGRPPARRPFDGRQLTRYLLWAARTDRQPITALQAGQQHPPGVVSMTPRRRGP